MLSGGSVCELRMMSISSRYSKIAKLWHSNARAACHTRVVGGRVVRRGAENVGAACHLSF
jgi:hypothetical protein